MLEVGDTVYFTPVYTRLLYSKGYRGAMCPWRVVDRVSDTQVRLEVERSKKTQWSSNHLVVTNTCVFKPS
jgi:hypothetical protein